MKRSQLPFCLLILMPCFGLAQNTTLSGKISAPTGEQTHVFRTSVKEGRYHVDTLASATLDGDGRFSMQFALDSAETLTFSDGNEVTEFFILPGELLSLSLHTAYFDETLHYAGQGGDRNNALAALALANEIDWMPMFSDNGDRDTMALSAQVDQVTERIGTLMEHLGRTYPEMTQYLLHKRAKQMEEAEGNKDYFREDVLFKNFCKTLVGKPMENLRGIGKGGEDIDLAAFRGKITVIDFWATWCGPCKAEMPHWKALEQELGDKVNFVSVGVWCKEDQWRDMAKELGLSNNMYISKEHQQQLQTYQVEYIPRYMVLDKDLNFISANAPRPSSPALKAMLTSEE